MSCVSSAETAVMNAAGMAAAASSGWRRFRLHLAGVTRTEQRAVTWDANAAFVASLGHDPAEVLGPRPGAERSLALVDA